MLFYVCEALAVRQKKADIVGTFERRIPTRAIRRVQVNNSRRRGQNNEFYQINEEYPVICKYTKIALGWAYHQNETTRRLYMVSRR